MGPVSSRSIQSGLASALTHSLKQSNYSSRPLTSSRNTVRTALRPHRPCIACVPPQYDNMISQFAQYNNSVRGSGLRLAISSCLPHSDTVELPFCSVDSSAPFFVRPLAQRGPAKMDTSGIQSGCCRFAPAMAILRLFAKHSNQAGRMHLRQYQYKPVETLSKGNPTRPITQLTI